MTINLVINDVGYDVTNDVIIESMVFTKPLFRALEPSSATFNFSLLQQSNIYDDLLTAIDEIECLVTESGVPVFTGFLTDNWSFGVDAKGRQQISLVAEDCLNKKLKKSWQSLNGKQTVYNNVSAISVVSDICSLAGIVFVTSSYYLGDLDTKKIFKVIRDVDDIQYYSVLKPLLLDFGYTFHIDEAGSLRLYKLINTGSDVAPNIPDLCVVRLEKNRTRYDQINVNWKSVKTLSNTVVFEDTTGADDTNPCNITVEAGAVYPSSSDGQAVLSQYQLQTGEKILLVVGAAPDVVRSPSSTLSFTDLGLYADLKITAGASPCSITKLRITATTVYAENETNITTSNKGGKKKYKYDAQYLNSTSAAEELADLLYNYFNNLDFSYTVKSKADLLVGSFVTLSEQTFSGISQKCRIVKKITRYKSITSKSYEYSIEAVGAATVTEKEIERIAPPKNNTVGPQGLPATVYSISSASPVLAKSVAGAFTPAAASFSFFSTTGTAAPVPYAGYWKIYETTDGSSWVLKETASANATGKSRTPTDSSVKGIRCELYAAGGVTTLLDTLTVLVVSDGSTGTPGSTGASAISGILQNESHSVPADADGNVTSYAGSGTEIRVYEGATLLAYDGVGTANGTWKVTAAGTGITPGGISDSGAFATVAVHSAMPAGTAIATILYTITGKTSAGVSFSFTKTQTITKAKTGATGEQGIRGANGNECYNSTLENGTDGWAFGVNSPVSTFGVNLSPDWNLLGGLTGYIRQSSATSGGYSDLHSRSIPVIGGETYEYQVRSGAHRCKAEVFVYWYDVSGATVGNSPLYANNAEMAGGKYLTAYKLIGGIATAPANAVYARLILRKSGTISGSDSYFFFTQPLFARASPGQTGLSPWTPTAIQGPQGSTGPQGQSSLGIGVKKGYAAFADINDGECYIHGFTTAGVADDVPGFIYFDEKKLTVNNNMLNPNYALDGYILLPVAGGVPVVGFFRISNQTWYSIVEGTFTALTEASWIAIGEMINTGAEVTESVSLYPRAVRLSEVRIALKQQFLGIAGAVTNGSGSVSLYQTTSAPYKFSSSAVGKRARPGDCAFVRGGTLVQAGTSDSIKALRVFDGYYWEAPRTEDYLKYRSMALIDLAASARVYKANGVAIPADIDAAYDVLVTNVLMAEKIKTLEIQFEEFVASIAGNTLVPRSGSTPGTRQIYMGKNPRYPNDATREYEFAMQEYLGMDGSKEVWMKHFWTRMLASGVAALTLTGCIQANNGVESRPGVVWKEITEPFGTSIIRAIAYGSDKWVAGGNNGKIAYSNDGQTFTLGTSPFGTSAIRGVAHGNGKWVMVGDDGKIAYSNNGQTFTLGTSPFGTSDIYCIAFGNDKWVAGGIGGKIAYSNDGQTFTLGTSPFGASTILSIAFGNDKWIAGGIGGKIAYSSNGQTFTLGTSPFGTYDIYCIAFGNDRWVVSGSGGKSAYSNDGQTFTLGTNPFVTYGAYGLIHGNGKWVMVGSSGKIAYSNDGKVFLDDDMQQPVGANGYFEAVACNDNGVFLAVGTKGSGDGLIIRSDPLEAGGGVVGKVYDSTRGELNKLWDGRYFPSYANVADIAPKLYKYFAPGTTQAAVYTALSPYMNPAVDSSVGCMGRWEIYETTRLYRRSSTQIEFFRNNNSSVLTVTSGSGTTLSGSLQVEFIIYQA